MTVALSDSPNVGVSTLSGLFLPPEWQLAKLGDLFEIQQGKALSSQSRQGRNPRPFLRTANVLWSRVNLATVDEMDFTDEEAARLDLRLGDLLICEGGEVGRAAVWNSEIPGCSFQNHIHRLRPLRDNVRPAFFMYWMRAALLHLQLYGGTENRTTIPNLSKGRLAQYLVPVPALAEQLAIAQLLEAVQRASESTEDVVRSVRIVRTSLMRHLFTYGPVSVGMADHVDLSESPIGRIPTHWRVVPLADLGQIVTGTTPSTARPDYYGDGHMFIAPGDIGESRVVTRSQKSLTDQGLGVSRALPKNAVLVVCIGATIGKTAMTSTDGCATNQQINAIVVSNDVDPVYLYYAITNRAHELPNLSGRAAIPIVNKSEFGKFLVALPPLDEQQLVAAALMAVDEKLETERLRRVAINALFDAVLPDLMTGRRRVSLDGIVR